MAFLDPDKLAEAAPADILEAASQGHLGLDHRFLHALLDRREEALPVVVEFSKRDRESFPVDLAPELIAIYRVWNTPDSVEFFIRYLKEDPEDVPDELIEALVAIGKPALEPLLKLYAETEESERGEIAFILANLRVKDERVLALLLDRLELDVADTALLLSVYGDPAAIAALETESAVYESGADELKNELAQAIDALCNPEAVSPPAEDEPFNIWALYPEQADLPVDLLDSDERAVLLDHPVAAVRAAAANSFFNRELNPQERAKMLVLAKTDPSTTVRTRAWESLMGATEETAVVEAMLAALRNPEISVEERGGLLVGLAPEADRNEVREAIQRLYAEPGGRAKALEAMWRSMHASFKENFAKHLDDEDLEVRRGAIWGVGYHNLRGELDRLRKLFDHEELRSDALFAYTLATPAELSRGRMKGLLARIEEEAGGLSEMEEELVKAALDERLMLAGKEPFFVAQED